MKIVLVTGAGGFLGRNVLPTLLRRGWEVHATSRHAPSSAGAETVRWHEVDLLDRAGVRSLVQTVRPAGLVHLAWDTTHGAYWKSPANLEWTAASLHLLHDFAAAGGRRVVVAGSSAEYEWGSEEPLDEMRSRLCPDSPYGACKNALRQIVEAWAPGAGVSWAWGRIFNLFGPEDKPVRLLPKVMRTLIEGKSLPFDDGRLVRDFLHVADAGDAFGALFASEVQGAVNVASGEPVAIREVVTTIASALGATGQLAFDAQPAPAGQPARVVAATARLRDEVGWQPAAGLAQRLGETCAWWRAQSARSVSPPH